MSLISIVIPAIKFDQTLRFCLDSLVKQKNVSLEVWVIFNPSKPNLDFSDWPSWIQFVESEKGVNCARNWGIRKSTADLIFFLDSDCVLNDPYHITKIIKFMELHPNASGVGGGYKVPQQVNLATKTYNYLQMDWLRQQIISADHRSKALIGGHMLLNKSKLPDLRFDENILFGGSEKELFVRLADSKTEFYLDLNFTILHISELTQKELLKKAKAQGRGERYIRTQYKTTKGDTFCYLIKPDFEPEWAKFIEGYERVFSKHSGSGTINKFSIRKILYRIIEHINVSQFGGN